MKKLTLTSVLAVLCLQMNAQKTDIKPLSIGDRVPDIVLTNVYNYRDSVIQLSDLKGKLILFDFMATSCGPCIKVLPKLDSLQKQYSNKVQFILITPEDPERIQAFLKNNKYLSLPLITNDSTITQYFPHKYISHVAWINPDRIVNGITQSEYINTKNIEMALEGHIGNLPVKRDITDYDFSQPLWQLNETKFPYGTLAVKHYNSAIVGYLPGVQKYNKVITDSINNTTHISLINFSILDLYRILFERFHLPLSYIELNITNTKSLIYQPEDGYYENWKSNNVYCLEALFPANIPISKQKEKLIEDLSFYFGLKATLQKKTTDCLIFRYNHQKLTYKNHDSVGDGLTVSQIVFLLNEKSGGMPVIDETKANAYSKIPITVAQVYDSSVLHKVLNQFGIELFVKKTAVELLVINETSGSSHTIINPKNSNK